MTRPAEAPGALAARRAPADDDVVAGGGPYDTFPTASTTPAPSWPIRTGSGCPQPPVSMMCRSRCGRRRSPRSGRPPRRGRAGRARARRPAGCSRSGLRRDPRLVQAARALRAEEREREISVGHGAGSRPRRLPARRPPARRHKAARAGRRRRPARAPSAHPRRGGCLRPSEQQRPDRPRRVLRPARRVWPPSRPPGGRRGSRRRRRLLVLEREHGVLLGQHALHEQRQLGLPAGQSRSSQVRSMLGNVASIAAAAASVSSSGGRSRRLRKTGSEKNCAQPS